MAMASVWPALPTSPRGASDLLEQNAPLGSSTKIRSQRRRQHFLRRDGIGQGSDDVLAGIVAEVLGINTFDIRLFTGDTDLGPVDLGSYSSRVTLMAGNAALQAAERGKAIIAEAVAEKTRSA